MGVTEAEIAKLEPFIVGIHVAVVNSPLEYPPPELHFYLASLIQKGLDPEQVRASLHYIQRNPFDEDRCVEIYDLFQDADIKPIPGLAQACLAEIPNPSPEIYWAAKANAEHISLEEAMKGEVDRRRIIVARVLYSTASFFSENFTVVDEEAEILPQVANRTPYCVDVLGAYFDQFAI